MSARSARRAARLLIVQLIALAVLSFAAIGRCGPPRLLVLDAVPVLPGDAGTPVLDAAGPCTDQASCTAACNLDGNAAAIDACVRRADLLRSGEGGLRDRAAARDLYRTVCFRSHDAVACTRLALDQGLLRDLDHAPDWLDPAHTPLALLAGACAMGGSRGELACAALELLGADAALAPDARKRLCADAPANECGVAPALRACVSGDAEACFLTATARLSSAPRAREQLDVLCNSFDPDQAACEYHYRKVRNEKWLIAACAELDSVRTSSLAIACLERASVVVSRRTELVERACKLGICQPVIGPSVPIARAVLETACRDGRLNACAVLIFTDRTDARLGHTLDRVVTRWPGYAAYARLGVADADVAACQLGSIAGCKAAIKRLDAGPAAARQRAAALKAYHAVLQAPLPEIDPTAPRTL